ncbi:MAG TPA: rRNA maturation RNase YbeY [Candidatus Limnocylindrales bacterium]|nr:rRNA maturation RNase YbeY [Candidatus Limnocylindrales bacterium]
MIIFETTVGGAGQAALERFARQAQKLARLRGEIAVLITRRRRIQELNRRFRRKDKPTDVLSFPREDGGDIAICAEIARENARRYGHALREELKILVLHGMLHLAGYDHENDGGEMARTEARLRALLKLPLALIERTGQDGGRAPKRVKAPLRSVRVRASKAAPARGRRRTKR